MKKNIVLVGFMGAGKSLISKELAKRYKFQDVSTDFLVESLDGRKIKDIFKESGEGYFRKLESEAINQIVKKDSQIIDCGGGAFVNQKNINRLKENGIIIYLKAEKQVLLSRTRKSKARPILNVKDPKTVLSELLDKREPFYNQAHYVVDTSNKTKKKVCDEIIGILSDE